MKLDKYNQKRDFKKTREPIGVKSKDSGKRFVIQHHLARRKHYDFRLEYDGVLLSFAIPKGLPSKGGERRLAVHVEDHPLDYINFEGIIPKGNYGAGSVEIFDSGVYKNLNNFKDGMKKGHLKFELFGDEINGTFSLVRINEPNWIILFSEKEQKSVTTPRKTKKKIKKNPFDKCSPKLALLSKKIPKDDYIFEIKYDGYRMLAYIDNNIRIMSRNNIDYTNKFPSIKKSLLELKASAILDGEVVSFDENGKSDFGLLQKNIKAKNNNFCYVVFDILAYDGRDLRGMPLLKRKDILRKVTKQMPQNIIFSEFAQDNGEKCFELAKKLNLEGIVAKRRNSPYNGERDEDWLKIKCYMRQEFVIGGYLTSSSNSLLSALLVGVYKNSKFKFVGKVGTGFNIQTKKQLNELFQKIKADKCPFEECDENAIWVKPKLVCEVQFAEFTKSYLLRQASFIGLRDDKKPQDVKLEISNEN